MAQVNEDEVQAIFLNPFNDLISVLKSLDVDAIDLCNSVFVYEGNDIFIEIDVSGLLSSDVEGRFPLDDKNLKKLSNVITSGKGAISVVKDKHDSFIIKKEGSKYEYHLEKLKKISVVPAAIKNATTISDQITATNEDINLFQKLSVSDLFLLKNNNRFTITNNTDFILDRSCIQYQKSHTLPRFITYRADQSKFQIKEQTNGTNVTTWLHVCYYQSGIPVNIYLKLTTKKYYQPTSTQKPPLVLTDLTLLTSITPLNFDSFAKFLSFFSKATEVIIHQGKTYAQFNSKLIAYSDSSAFFSKQVSFKIKEPGKYLKKYAQLYDNAGCAISYDLIDRKPILIARDKLGDTIFIRVPPGRPIPVKLPSYLSVKYEYARFGSVKVPPKVFGNLNMHVERGITIDKKYREKILNPIFYELTNQVIAKIKKDKKTKDFPADGFKKPTGKKFSEDILDAVKPMVGKVYTSDEQFATAYDNATRKLIDAIIKGDEAGDEIHARKRDFKTENEAQRRIVITQNDLNLYRPIIAEPSLVPVKKAIATFELYSENNRLRFCTSKGLKDITHFIDDYNEWDSMHHSKYFLSFDADYHQCSISNQNSIDWLVTNHRFQQKDILTFEDLGNKVKQQNPHVIISHSTCNDPVKEPIQSLTLVRNGIIHNYKQHLNHRFEMMQGLCNILKNKHYYFKDDNQMLTFFEELREDLAIAKSTFFADRRIAEMLITFSREDLLDEYKNGMSYKLMKITSAYDDSTKEYLLNNIELDRKEIDEFVAQSRPQFSKEPNVESKVRGMKIKKERNRIVLSFEQKWDEKPEQVKKKIEKITKLIAQINDSNLND
jgi:hypothetical protein